MCSAHRHQAHTAAVINLLRLTGDSGCASRSRGAFLGGAMICWYRRYNATPVSLPGDQPPRGCLCCCQRARCCMRSRTQQCSHSHCLTPCKRDMTPLPLCVTAITPTARTPVQDIDLRRRQRLQSSHGRSLALLCYDRLFEHRHCPCAHLDPASLEGAGDKCRMMTIKCNSSVVISKFCRRFCAIRALVKPSLVFV